MKTETTSLEDLLARFDTPTCSVEFPGVKQAIPVPELIGLLHSVHAGGMVVEVVQDNHGLRLTDPGRKAIVGWLKRDWLREQGPKQAPAHTPECQQRQVEWEAARTAWREKWPDACGHCHGTGGTYHHGSFYEPPSVDPCPGCVEDGNCARCGSPLANPDEGEGPCLACGWDFDDSMPEPYECGCWYSDPDPD